VAVSKGKKKGKKSDGNDRVAITGRGHNERENRRANAKGTYKETNQNSSAGGSSSSMTEQPKGALKKRYPGGGISRKEQERRKLHKNDFFPKRA